MSLLQRLLENERAMPKALAPGPTPRPVTGMVGLPPEMAAVLTRVAMDEVPTFPARLAAARAQEELADHLAHESVAINAPVDTPAALPSRRPPIDPCPNCGGAAVVTRLDLTTDVGWFQCNDCGLRFGGSLSDRTY